MAVSRIALLGCTLLFISFASAFEFPDEIPDDIPDKICIGYRTVAPEQAEEYERAGNTLVWDPHWSDDTMSSYGKGVYLTPGLGQWEGAGEKMYCLVAADKDPFFLAGKVRLPAIATYDDDCEYQKLEYNTALTTRYIHEMGRNPQTDIRILRDKEGDLEFEIIIPPSSLNQNGLGIETLCRKQMEQLPQPLVNLKAWPWNNTVGSWDSWSIDGLLPGEEHEN